MSDDFKILEEENEEELPSEDVIGEEITQDDIDNAEIGVGDLTTPQDPVFREKELFGETLKSLVNLLPNQYNKEVSDTNYYKLLRSLALELSNSKIEVLQLKDDMYLSTVQPDRIYDNFGTLVKLQKNNDWDSEKYRRLIKGVIQSLLKGPTKQSLVDGLNLFTDFKINVYELYKEEDRVKVDPSIFDHVDYQYSFVLEIEKPVEAFADQQALIRDANYIVNIIKPAHTISVIITTIVGEESYRQSYRERFNIDAQAAALPPELQQFGLPDYHGMDSVQTEAELNHKDNIYGYKYKGDGVFGVGSLIGGPDLIGPVYFLNDTREDWYFEQWLQELYGELEDVLGDVGLEYADSISTVDKFKDIVPELGVDYVEWFKTLQMKNQVTDLQYELDDSYSTTLEVIENLNSHLQLDKTEDFILTNELEEYDENTVEIAETKFDTPMVSRQVNFSLTWEEDYNMFMNKGRFTLSSNQYRSLLNGRDLLTAPTPDHIDNIEIYLNELVDRTNWEDSYSVYSELNASDIFNTQQELQESMTTVKYELYDVYDKSTKADDNISVYDVVTAESVNFQSNTTDESFSHYETSTYVESYTPKSTTVDSGVTSTEVSTMISIEATQRFVFNKTIIGTARLGGTIRDQMTMRLENADGSIIEAAVQ